MSGPINDSVIEIPFKLTVIKGAPHDEVVIGPALGGGQCHEGKSFKLPKEFRTLMARVTESTARLFSSSLRLFSEALSTVKGEPQTPPTRR